MNRWLRLHMITCSPTYFWGLFKIQDYFNFPREICLVHKGCHIKNTYNYSAVMDMKRSNMCNHNLSFHALLMSGVYEFHWWRDVCVFVLIQASFPVSSSYSEYRTWEGSAIIFPACLIIVFSKSIRREWCSLTTITFIAVWNCLFICDFDWYVTKQSWDSMM